MMLLANSCRAGFKGNCCRQQTDAPLPALTTGAGLYKLSVKGEIYW